MAPRKKAIHEVPITNSTGSTRVWTVEEVKREIETNDKALIRALLRVYSWQTSEEQKASVTIDHNNVGFNGADSYILSRLAEFHNRNHYLSTKQIAIARKRMPKYAKQIFNSIVQNNVQTS